MRTLRLINIPVGALVFALTLLPGFHFPIARAASLTAISDTLSSTTATETGVTHTVAFTTASTDLLKRIYVRFSTTQGGTTRPSGLSLQNATLGTVGNLGSDWTLSTSFYASGILFIERPTAASVPSGSLASIEFNNITNSAIDNCEAASDTLLDTCHVRITTYSDDGTTSVDSGDTTYTVREDPFLTFQVEDVSSGQTHNGVTSNISSSSTGLSFGRIPLQTVRYGTHKLTITTNAPRGYTVYAKLEDEIEGVNFPNVNFDPFGATNATWSNPQAWSSPDGTSPSINSGWFGANTSDTRVSGWSTGSGRFGPLGTTARPVATSAGPERAGVVIYISYALEANIVQAGDTYLGSLTYNIQPLY
ncbi:MAG TPA: hypothetical protein VLA04_02225 [Verrucomicrobiae bacterium]|nr:hypothetical protein [Verrucomicrobiae bacterium]